MSGPQASRVDRPRVRRAKQEESQAIADLWLRARRAAVPGIPPALHSDDDVRAWYQSVVLPQRECWVAEVGGALVAMMVLDGDWLDQLYVEPGLTSCGHGTTLLAVAKRERPGGLKLWTFAANTGARRFYERHGFWATAETSGDNEEGAPDVRYEWAPRGRS